MNRAQTTAGRSPLAHARGYESCSVRSSEREQMAHGRSYERERVVRVFELPQLQPHDQHQNARGASMPPLAKEHHHQIRSSGGRRSVAAGRTSVSRPPTRSGADGAAPSTTRFAVNAKMPGWFALEASP